MKTFTKKELKENAQEVLKYNFGFAPALKNIVLMEADMNGEYIGIDVNGHGYQIYGKVLYLTNGTCIGLDVTSAKLTTIIW